jgi:hypothetical protein
VGKNPHKWLNHAGLRVFQKWAKSGQKVGKWPLLDKNVLKIQKSFFTNFIKKSILPTFMVTLPTFCPLSKSKVGKYFHLKFTPFSPKI